MVGVEPKHFKWFGQVKRMSRLRLTGRVYGFEEEERRNRGKSYTRWLAGVKKLRNVMSVELREAKVMCNTRLQ